MSPDGRVGAPHASSYVHPSETRQIKYPYQFAMLSNDSRVEHDHRDVDQPAPAPELTIQETPTSPSRPWEGSVREESRLLIPESRSGNTRSDDPAICADDLRTLRAFFVPLTRAVTLLPLYFTMIRIVDYSSGERYFSLIYERPDR